MTVNIPCTPRLNDEMAKAAEVSPQSAVDSALTILWHALDDQGDLINSLGSRLGPILTSDTPAEETDMIAGVPDRSEVCDRIHTAIRQIERQSDTIRRLRHRLDI